MRNIIHVERESVVIFKAKVFYVLLIMQLRIYSYQIPCCCYSSLSTFALTLLYVILCLKKEWKECWRMFNYPFLSLLILHSAFLHICYLQTYLFFGRKRCHVWGYLIVIICYTSRKHEIHGSLLQEKTMYIVQYPQRISYL